MTLRSRLLAVAAIAGVALMPTRASAQTSTCGNTGYTFTLGLGGALTGCFTGVLTQLGEDAGLVSQQYYWAGNFTGTSGITNAPTTAGTFMSNDNCGSGGNGSFAFCTGTFAQAPVSISNLSGELVLGLDVPDNFYGTGFYWNYSGSQPRNGSPAPAGFQEVLLQLTIGGVVDPGQFLYGWEDLNSGCIARSGVNTFREEDLGNGALLNSDLGTCTTILPGGDSDSDFNDSWMRFDISGIGTPADVVPEPMTMSLMAIGLVGMGAASIRRRKK